VAAPLLDDNLGFLQRVEYLAIEQLVARDEFKNSRSAALAELREIACMKLASSGQSETGSHWTDSTARFQILRRCAGIVKATWLDADWIGP